MWRAAEGRQCSSAGTVKRGATEGWWVPLPRWTMTLAGHQGEGAGVEVRCQACPRYRYFTRSGERGRFYSRPKPKRLLRDRQQ